MATPPPQHVICPTVGKPAGLASRAGAYRPDSVTALWLLSYPLPASQTEPNGRQTWSRAFCMCAPSSLPAGVLQPAVSVCEMVCALSLIALAFSSAKETGLGPAAPGEIQAAEEPRTAASATVAGPLLRLAVTPAPAPSLLETQLSPVDTEGTLVSGMPQSLCPGSLF